MRTCDRMPPAKKTLKRSNLAKDSLKRRKAQQIVCLLAVDSKYWRYSRSAILIDSSSNWAVPPSAVPHKLGERIEPVSWRLAGASVGLNSA